MRFEYFINLSRLNYLWQTICKTTRTHALVSLLSKSKSVNNTCDFTSRGLISKMDLSGERTAYNDKQHLFLEETIKVKDPLNLFEQWFKLISMNPNIIEPNAMCLSTATKDGAPSARFVLLKGFDENGFRFFTHYTSRKGQELEENLKAALTFYWPEYSRSVRIEGIVEKLPMSVAEDYFHGRPYRSQIGSSCSDQSKPIAGRHVLAEKEKELMTQHPEGPVPKPPQWGGYVVKPHSIEFWQGQTDRIHDRIRFRKPALDEKPDGIITHQGESGWIYERLSP